MSSKLTKILDKFKSKEISEMVKKMIFDPKQNFNVNNVLENKYYILCYIGNKRTLFYTDDILIAKHLEKKFKHHDDTRKIIFERYGTLLRTYEPI